MYSSALEIGLDVLAVLIAIPSLTLLIEALAAGRPARRLSAAPPGEHPRVAVLIPAHDEEAVIRATLQSVVPQLRKSDRLLVVADNCTDATARIARGEGAEVIDRVDAARKGKGYALDHGVRHLAQDAPEVLIIVDADCLLEPGAIAALAGKAARAQRPVQALYLMDAPPGGGFGLRIAQFAWIFKNHVRPLGLQRLRLPCQLMGTGMAFPWPYIKNAPLASGHIVEDLRLGIDLALDGHPPLFCADALVRSSFPASGDGVRTQRTRWEHGHLRTILEDTPRLLAKSLIRGDIRLAAMAADLAVPPLALLALGSGAIWTASLAGSCARLGWLPLALSTIAVLSFGVAVSVSWWRFGRHIVSAADLRLVPIYALAKVPLYLKFLLRPQSRWVRSSRDRDT